jgi:hypothetical protein
MTATNPRMDLLLLPVRLFEYRVVREQHNRARYPKRYRRGHDHVHLIYLERQAIMVFNFDSYHLNGVEGTKAQGRVQ